MKRKIALSLIMVIVLVLFTGCDKSDYNKAVDLVEQGKYEAAVDIFTELGDYQDSQQKLEEAKKYLEITKALEDGVWYFEAESANAVNRLLFADGKAAISQAFFDGNGYHESSSVEQLIYKIEDSKIVLVKEDLSEIEISYELKDGALVLDEKAYFTPEMIEDGIQGYWKLRDSQYIVGMLSVSEYNIHFDNGNVASENAAKAAGTYDGSYYYYGPYSGTYEIGFGCFETEMRHGSEWFFRIDDGEVQVLHYNKVCVKSDKLPGEDGYEF